MRRTPLTTLPIAVCGFLLMTGSATAQESTTRGFTVGIHSGGASLVVENQDRNNAAGGGIHIGYGVNRRVTILAQFDGAQFDEQSTGDVQGDWTIGNFDVGVRFHFANSLRKWVPYLQAALGRRVVSVSDPIVNNTTEERVSLSGAAFTLGGGLDYYLSQTLALELQLLLTGGEFTTVTINNTSVTGFDFDASSSRFNIGLTWWP